MRFLPFINFSSKSIFWYLNRTRKSVLLSFFGVRLRYQIILLEEKLMVLLVSLSLSPSLSLSLSLSLIYGRFRPCFYMNANITLIGHNKISGNWLVTQIKENLWYLIIQISFLCMYISDDWSLFIFSNYLNRYKSNIIAFVKL